MRNNKNTTGFTKYTFIGFIISLLNIILLYVMIDIFHISTIVSSTIVVCSLFVLKFILYKKIGLFR